MSCAAGIRTTQAARPSLGQRIGHLIEPLRDARWEGFIREHPRSSVFHSSPWLTALSQTYGYQPVAYTTSPVDQDLHNAIVFCRVESWLTGRRLVSLPFSDHCEPLLDDEEDAQSLATAIEKDAQREGWRYVEMRPLQPLDFAISMNCSTVDYTFHELDLAPDINTLFRNCHKDSTQRKIRRAEREPLNYREGSSEELLDYFYELFTITRKRHRIPPPPRKWFLNLMNCFGGALKIRVAFKGDKHVAAIITIRHKDTLVYKYGGCDTRFTNLGSMHFLLWKSIQEAKALGLRSFDFGRSDEDQPGLIVFKSRWGSERSTLTYARYSFSQGSKPLFDLFSFVRKSKTAKFVVSRLPLTILSRIGSAVYCHVG